MANTNNRQKLYRFFEKTLKERDKFQSVVLKVSEFGLVQMTRKRSGKTLIQQLTNQCPTCHGAGFIKSMPNESYNILRKLKAELESKKIGNAITLSLHPVVFHYITNTEYNSILQLEKTYKCRITLMSKEQCSLNGYCIERA